MVAWYWYTLGVIAIFFVVIGLEWLYDFYITWSFEE